MDTFKWTLNKLQGNEKTTKENLITFLTTYRITPNQNLPQIHFGKPHLSPAEVLLGRSIRTRLDLIKENLYLTITKSQQQRCPGYGKNTKNTI